MLFYQTQKPSFRLHREEENKFANSVGEQTVVVCCYPLPLKIEIGKRGYYQFRYCSEQEKNSATYISR